MAQYAESIQRMREAADRGGAARYPTNFADGHAMLLDHLGPLRSGAFLLRLDASIKLRHGDTRGAVGNILAIHRLARSLESEPILVSQMVAVAIHSIAYHQIEATMNDVTLAHADLADLRAECAKVQYKTGFRRAMIGERAIGIMSIDNPGILDTVQDPIPLVLHYARGDDLAMYL